MAAPLSGVVLQQPSIPEVDFKTATILKAHSLQFASGQRVDFIPIRLKRRLELIRCVCLQPCRILRYLFGQPGSPCLLARSYSLILRDFNPRTPCGVRQRKCTKFSAHFAITDNSIRVSPSGVPSVGALFTYSRGLRRAGAGANLPVNGCALGLRAKASAGARLPSELRKRSLFKSRRSLLAPVQAAVPFQCNSRQQRTESCPNFSA